MTQRDHVRPTVRVWAGLAATAVAITAIATATSGSAAAMHSSAAQTEDMAAMSAIADHVGTNGGVTSATASSDLLDGGFAEQFREDQVTLGDPLNDTYYAEADIFAVTGLMSPTGVTALGVGRGSVDQPVQLRLGVRLHRAAVGHRRRRRRRLRVLHRDRERRRLRRRGAVGQR